MRAWLVRAGRGGEREAWALGAGCTGGGFGGVADLGGAVDREAVLTAVRAAKPDAAEQALRNFTAQLWALRSRMAEGDLVGAAGRAAAPGRGDGARRGGAAGDVGRDHEAGRAVPVDPAVHDRGVGLGAAAGRVFANYPALPPELRAELPLRQVWALVEEDG